MSYNYACMATYKVPQDVEAEDKIVGFLSLKQLIFVIIMIASLWMCWILFQANILLGFIPLPIALVSGVLGLYQRKDQPVEVFLASWLRFQLKPRKRKWDQEGLEERVIITAPKHIEKMYTKGLSQEQVNSRLTQLSSIMDTRGWAAKRIGDQQLQTSGQRLFSIEEMQRFSAPVAPIDLDVHAVTDPYDTTDPRNATAQEVERDMNYVAQKSRKDALAVVEAARNSTPKPPISLKSEQVGTMSQRSAPQPETTIVETAPTTKVETNTPDPPTPDSTELVIEHKK